MEDTGDDSNNNTRQKASNVDDPFPVPGSEEACKALSILLFNEPWVDPIEHAHAMAILKRCPTLASRLHHTENDECFLSPLCNMLAAGNSPSLEQAQVVYQMNPEVVMIAFGDSKNMVLNNACKSQLTES